MSTEIKSLIHAQVGKTRTGATQGDEAVYTFTGGLRGAGLEFEFSLFGLARGEPGRGAEADGFLREAARHLLREIYLPLLPWETVDRPNPHDTLSTVMKFDTTHIEAAIFAVIVDQYVHLAWHGGAQAYHLASASGVEPIVSEDETGITSLTLSGGEYLLLCATGVCQEIATDDVYQAVYQASSLFDACDRLAAITKKPDEDVVPPAILVHRPHDD
ncbi:MAG: hypothetical protein JXB47_16995 [Anaerolineae bacterium]|nr:hypothetical protein [Anaerolineae bacterium]